jgi:hypothetical protein
MDPSRVDLLLDSPLGRQFLVGFLGFEFGQELFDQLGLGQVPGTVALTAGGVQQRAPGRRRRWQDVAPHEAGAVIRAAVAQEEWRSLLGLDEVTLLAALADGTFGFGFGEDAAVQALIALAKQELRPVAEALVSAPGTRRWWEPVVRGDQRFLEWDDGSHLAGPAVEQAVRDRTLEERAENAKGLKQRRRRERRGTRIGAVWWSAPDFAAQTWTTGVFGDVPTIALGHFIDTFTPFEETGATVWSLQIAPQARVLEIRTPADWQALVVSFPRDVTRHCRGQSRPGRGWPAGTMQSRSSGRSASGLPRSRHSAQPPRRWKRMLPPPRRVGRPAGPLRNPRPTTLARTRAPAPQPAWLRPQALTEAVGEYAQILPEAQVGQP